MRRPGAAINKHPPVTMPTRYPSPARPPTCSAEMLEASRDMPINGHRRVRPAKKYSASVCFLPAARRTAPTTSARLRTMITESRMPNKCRALLSDSEFVGPSNSIRSNGAGNLPRGPKVPRQKNRSKNPKLSKAEPGGVQSKKGSAQEFDRAPISCGFLKGYEFYLRCGQALG